jgi:clan AA aspartic protease
MGLVYQQLRLSNPYESGIEEIDATALVDTGATELCIPEHMANQLKLKYAGERIIHLANGEKQVCDVMMTVRIEVFGLVWNGQAIITGDEVLLGAIPMESLNLIVDPKKQIAFPNPDNLNVPVSKAKGARR